MVLDEEFGYQALEAGVFCLQLVEGFGGTAVGGPWGAGLIGDFSLRGFGGVVVGEVIHMRGSCG
jgi:hypothetical protein